MTCHILNWIFLYFFRRAWARILQHQGRIIEVWFFFLTIIKKNTNDTNLRAPDNPGEKYSGTPPFGHPVNTVTLLLRPLYSGPKKISVSCSGTPSYGHPVNTVTLLLRPLYSGPNKRSVSYFLICLNNP